MAHFLSPFLCLYGEDRGMSLVKFYPKCHQTNNSQMIQFYHIYQLYMHDIIYKQSEMGNDEPHSCEPSEEVKEIYSIYSRSLIASLNQKKKLKGHPFKNKRVDKDVFEQLFESFQRYAQYRWSKEIVVLFIDYFEDYFGAFWDQDKEIFYRQMLENSGLSDYLPKKFKSYEHQFYSCEHIKIKQAEDQSSINNRIQALNSSIMDESQIAPFVPFIISNKKMKKKARKNSYGVVQSMIDINHADKLQYYNEPETHHSYTSQYYDSEILRSSVIVPETVFVQRLNQESKFKVNNMLNFYKVFSESLQQLVRNLTLMACPLKHFQIYLKRKVKLKKIKSSQSTTSLTRDPRKTAIMRKKKQYNNSYLLVQIRDFTQAYTEFIWKYLNLYRIVETQFSTFITMDTAYGVILKLVWSFTSWIGERGYEWEQRKIPSILQILHEQQIKLSEGNKKKSKFTIQLDENIIRLGCDLSSQINPQKYLKKIVIIYRQLSKKCSNADQLILYYQGLFQQISKRNSCNRLFKMQNIIDKLLKMEDACGQICYAWTTWNIMVETIRKKILMQENQIQAQKDFKNYLSTIQKSRLSG